MYLKKCVNKMLTTALACTTALSSATVLPIQAGAADDAAYDFRDSFESGDCGWSGRGGCTVKSNGDMPYAESTSPEDLKASRFHRAYGGFSMGAVSTWAVLTHCLDIVAYFMPLSGDHWGGTQTSYDKAKAIANAIDPSGLQKDEYFICCATGTTDIAYPNLGTQVEEMKKMSQFVYTSDLSQGNFYFLVAEGKDHWWGNVRHYVYDMLPYFFHEHQQ